MHGTWRGFLCGCCLFVGGSLASPARLAAQTVSVSSAPATPTAPGEIKQPPSLLQRLRNPASLATLPLQLNYVSGGELGDRTLALHLVQPAVPLPLSDNFKLLSRTVLPLVNLPLPDGSRQFALLDTQEQLFLIPRELHYVSWGIGPTLSIPTATTSVLGSGQWGLGPGALLVVPAGPATLAAFANHVWSVSENGARPKLSLFSMQPFLTLALPRGWSLVSSPLILGNFAAARTDRWTLPLGLGAGKLFTLAEQLMNISLHYYRDVLYPPGFGANQVRIQMSFWWLMPVGA
jgi:hypothetical protein